MPTRNLSAFFRPRSIALIGASGTPGTVGNTVLTNLMGAGFDGPVRIVNPKRDHIGPYPCRNSISDLPEAPDLAVIAAPAATVPGIIDELGGRGTRNAVIITAGLGKGPGSLGAETLANARRHDMRLLGPNCIGLLVPEVGLNASFAHINTTVVTSAPDCDRKATSSPPSSTGPIPAASASARWSRSATSSTSTSRTCSTISPPT